MTLTPLTDADVEDAEALDARCFPNPGERVDFMAEIARDHAILLGMRIRGSLVGYLLAWLVADRLEILNVAVDPVQRRKGVGLVLVDGAVREARNHGAQGIDLEVRASNEAAIGLYEALGFQRVGLRASYYRNPVEDAILLTRPLG